MTDKDELDRFQVPSGYSFAARRALAAFLGINSSLLEADWYWQQFFDRHGNNDELMARFCKWIESTDEGDPAVAANWLISTGRASPEWGRKIVERCLDKKLGAPAWNAFLFVNDGYASSKWGKEVVEACVAKRLGDPARAAYRFMSQGHASPEWCRAVIEMCAAQGVGDPVRAASWLVGEGHVSDEWAEQIKSVVNTRKEDRKESEND